MTKKQVIAAFDFDETLIARDTLPDFLFHSISLPRFILGVLRCTPMLISFKLKKISNQSAKENLLTVFLGGMTLEHFTGLCTKYIARLNTIANPIAIERLQWHQQRGHKVVIISASPEDWINPWAKQWAVDTVISTKLETIDDKLTGKLATPNCHGAEKVTRFLAKYPDRDNYELYMYGDGKSDKQMFQLADKAFEKVFA